MDGINHVVTMKLAFRSTNSSTPNPPVGSNKPLGDYRLGNTSTLSNKRLHSDGGGSGGGDPKRDKPELPTLNDPPLQHTSIAVVKAMDFAKVKARPSGTKGQRSLTEFDGDEKMLERVKTVYDSVDHGKLNNKEYRREWVQKLCTASTAVTYALFNTANDGVGTATCPWCFTVRGRGYGHSHTLCGRATLISERFPIFCHKCSDTKNPKLEYHYPAHGEHCPVVKNNKGKGGKHGKW